MHLELDTIAAISTPPGRGAIGIVRLSGPAALTIPNLSSTPQIPRRAHLTRVLDEHGILLDQAIATWYRAPHSYTGEGVVELALHGAPVLLDAVLRACIARGARLAEPGEFTRRAFLAGRLDLAQAEAVRDLIDAHTLEQARVAARQLGGSLAQAIAPAKANLLSLIAALEAGIDFAEDDLELLPAPAIAARLAQIGSPLRELAGTYAYGRVVRDGFTLALVGPPNAGKSSLFNALLGHERAIVTAEPGTTRDTLAERTTLAGLPVTLIDTAGLRDSPSTEAEALGIARTRHAIAEADLILLISAADTPSPGVPQDHQSLVKDTVDAGSTDAQSAHTAPQFPDQTDLSTLSNVLPVQTKADLSPSLTGTGLLTSARTGQGIEALRDAIHQRLGGVPAQGELITSLRQHTALAAAVSSLDRAAAALSAGIPHEMLLLDLYTALGELDALTGATGSEEILHRIFAEFCIGK